MARKTQSILFIVACSLCLLLSFANKAGMAAGLLAGKHNSSLEGRVYQTRPALSLSALRSGEYQNAFESYVADGVFMRDGVLLLNAALQRCEIALANVPFGFAAYPTNFDSSRAYVPAYDAIVPIAQKCDQTQEDSYAAALDELKAFADRHPDLRVWVMEVDNADMCSANPTQALVSNPLGTDDAHRMLLDVLPEGTEAVGHHNETADDLFSAYYRTDHHWTTAEGYRSYVEAISAMRPGDAPASVTEDRVFLCDFLGSHARVGLCLPLEADVVHDLRCDLSGVEILVNNEKASEDAVDSWERYTAGERDPGMFANIYATYYHGDYALLEFVNPSCANDDGLLIIGNSYGNCMERFFCTNYRRVVKLDGRHTDLKADELLAEDPSIADVLVIGTPGVILTGSLDAITVG